MTSWGTLQEEQRQLLPACAAELLRKEPDRLQACKCHPAHSNDHGLCCSIGSAYGSGWLPSNKSHSPPWQSQAQGPQ